MDGIISIPERSDKKEDLPTETVITASDSFDELSREDIISKDAEITRLQEFSHSSSESSLNIEKEGTNTNGNKQEETDSNQSKDINSQESQFKGDEPGIIETNKTDLPITSSSIPSIVVEDQTTQDNSKPIQNDTEKSMPVMPKRPAPPKKPAPPSINEDKDNSPKTAETAVIIVDSASTEANQVFTKPQESSVVSQPVAPPRKKRHQKKV